MKVAAKIKLFPTDEQYSTLKETMIEFNKCCNHIAEIAFKNGISSKFEIQKLAYDNIRKQFPQLSSQMVIRAIAKVVEAYKKDKTTKPQFKLTGAVVYDQRIMSLKSLTTVSLWTIKGREIIKMLITGYQKVQLGRGVGQSDLILVDNIFYLVVTVDVQESPTIDTQNIIGIDMGIIKTATISSGEVFDGAIIEKVRQKYATLRKNLQKCGTKSSKRHLKKIGAKESRFRKNLNHIVSKFIVEKAKGTQSSIAIENLKGIKDKVTVRKSQRNKHHSWSFYQLKEFILYKAKITGILVVEINPKYTSQECFKCGHISRFNRKSQSEFKCEVCGYFANADVNASNNIALRGAKQLASYVIHPNVATSLLATSPRL